VCPRPDAPARPCRADRGQRGFALVEVLVALVLAGLLITAISTGMFTMLRVTGVTSQTQRMATALMNTTESLRATTYRPCGSSPAPTAARYDQDHAGDPAAWRPASGSGITARVTGLAFWSGAGAGGFGEFRPACPDGGDQGRQRLTVTVSMEGRPDVTGTVVIAEPQLEPGP
jgi:prepilin-type N-terminal cleavage/methylation domain-containing protein